MKTGSKELLLFFATEYFRERSSERPEQHNQQDRVYEAVGVSQTFCHVSEHYESADFESPVISSRVVDFQQHLSLVRLFVPVAVVKNELEHIQIVEPRDHVGKSAENPGDVECQEGQGENAIAALLTLLLQQNPHYHHVESGGDEHGGDVEQQDRPGPGVGHVIQRTLETSLQQPVVFLFTQTNHKSINAPKYPF